MELGTLLTSSPYKRNKFTLIIDGNFFGMRLLMAEGLKFDNEYDKFAFFKTFCTSLSKQIRELKSVIDNVIFVKDEGSWRKRMNVVKPIGSDTSGYKTNRNYGDSDIDFNAYFEAYNEIMEFVSNELNIPVVRFENAEGDDGFFIVSRILSKNGIKSLIWTSDGDSVTLVNKFITICKLPKYNLLVSQDFKEYYESLNSPINALVGSQRIDETKDYILNSPMDVVNPSFELLSYIIKGQKKDNITPLYTFTKYKRDTKTKIISETKSRTGLTMANKASIKEIIKALTACNLDSENLDFNVFYDDDVLKKFITELLNVCSQREKVRKFFRLNKTEITEDELDSYDVKCKVDVEHTMRVFKSNRKLMALNTKEVPKHIIQGLIESFKSQASMKPDLKKLSNVSNYIFKLPSCDSMVSKMLVDNKVSTNTENTPIRLKDVKNDKNAELADSLLSSLF